MPTLAECAQRIGARVAAPRARVRAGSTACACTGGAACACPRHRRLCAGVMSPQVGDLHPWVWVRTHAEHRHPIALAVQEGRRRRRREQENRDPKGARAGRGTQHGTVCTRPLQ